MKKVYNLLFFGIVAVLCMSLTSCNNDEYDARLLAGYWEGNISSVSWRSETFNYVDFYFEKDPSYGAGHGVETDYDEWGYIVSRGYFDYEVVGGSLRLSYYQEENGYGYRDVNYYVWIDDWYITDSDILRAKFRYGSSTVTWNLRRIGGWHGATWRSNYGYSKDIPFEESKEDSVAPESEGK